MTATIRPLSRHPWDSLWVLWWSVVLLVNLPGHLTHDSLTQIAEGRSGVFESWNPMALSVWFGYWVDLTGGPEVLVWMSSLLLMLSMRAVVQPDDWGGPWAWPLVGVMLCAPVLLIYPGIVWKDVWFAHLTLAGLALAAQRHRGAGWGWEPLSLLLLAAAMLTRQTGVVATSVVVMVLASARTAATDARWTDLVVAWAWRMAVMVVMAALLSVGVKAMSQRIVGAPVATGVRLVAMFDLAGMLQRDPSLSLARLESQGVEVQALEAAARRSFSAERVDTLDLPPVLWDPKVSTADVLWQWADLVAQRPWVYLRHRAEVVAWWGGWREQQRCLPVHVGIDPGTVADRAGIRPPGSRWSHALYLYTQPWVNTPYFSPLAWLAVSVGVWCLWWACGLRRHPVAWLQVAGVMYGLSYFPIGFSCDYRYSYFTVLAAMVGVMATVAQPRRWWEALIRRA